jgi:hypothetical protein
VRLMSEPRPLFTCLVEESTNLGEAVLAEIVPDDGMLFAPYAYWITAKV